MVQPAPGKIRPRRSAYNRLILWGFGAFHWLSGAAPAAAQSRSVLLPNDVPTFEFPYASSRTSAMVGRAVYVSKGDSKFGAEWEGEAGLGEILPLVAFARGRVPITLHFGVESYGRFSLGDAASALISNDWHVNLILAADLKRWRLAFEGYHESSHLGDEYRDRYGVNRVNWSREIAGIWVTRTAGQLKFHLNGSYALIDAINVGRGAVVGAVDYQGKPGSVIGGGSARLILAAQVDAQAYTDWQATVSGRAGVRFADPNRRRGFALLLTYLDGMSPQRQFFLEKTRYLGMEVRFDL